MDAVAELARQPAGRPVRTARGAQREPGDADVQRQRAGQALLVGFGIRHDQGRATEDLGAVHRVGVTGADVGPDLHALQVDHRDAGAGGHDRRLGRDSLRISRCRHDVGMRRGAGLDLSDLDVSGTAVGAADHQVAGGRCDPGPFQLHGGGRCRGDVHRRAEDRLDGRAATGLALGQHPVPQGGRIRRSAVRCGRGQVCRGELAGEVEREVLGVGSGVGQRLLELRAQQGLDLGDGRQLAAVDALDRREQRVELDPQVADEVRPCLQVPADQRELALQAGRVEPVLDQHQERVEPVADGPEVQEQRGERRRQVICRRCLQPPARIGGAHGLRRAVGEQVRDGGVLGQAQSDVRHPGRAAEARPGADVER